MDRRQAIVLVRDTFTQRFDEGRFRHFLRNLVNHLDESNRLQFSGNLGTTCASVHTLIRVVNGWMCWPFIFGKIPLWRADASRYATLLPTTWRLVTDRARLR